jgi:hypothetical protein
MKQTFQQYLEQRGYEPRCYSGRGMYGKTCLAITIEGNVLQQMMDMAYAIGMQEGESTDDEIVEMPFNVLTDSMGLDTVVYWPNVPFVE